MKNIFSKLAFTTLALTTVGCSTETFTLPNGEIVEVRRTSQSDDHRGSTKIDMPNGSCKKMKEYIELSRIEGVVTYMGPLEVPEREDISIVTQTAVGGSGLLEGGHSINNYADSADALVLKATTDLDQRVLYVNQTNGVPAGILYSTIKVGDTISFPTLEAINTYGCHLRTLRSIERYSLDDIDLERSAEVEPEVIEPEALEAN